MAHSNERKTGIGTPPEVADYLGIPRKNRPRKAPAKYITSENRSKTVAVVRLIERGELEGLQIEGEWRVTWESVYAYEDRQRLKASELIQARRLRRQRGRSGPVIAADYGAKAPQEMPGNVGVA